MIAGRNLAGGLTVSELGFGGAPLGGMYMPVSREDARAALDMAWSSGVRVYDTAPLYGFGQSERLMGDYLRAQPRDSFTLSTKVGRLLRPNAGHHQQREFFHNLMPFEPVFDYSHDSAIRSLEDSLQRLGLERVDIALVHDIDVFTHGAKDQPKYCRQALDGAFRALRRLKEEGAVRAIGVGVNECEVCELVMSEMQIDCILLAGRYTLLEQGALDSLLPRCAREGVSVMIGGAFNSGVLVAKDSARQTYNYLPADAEIRARAAQIREICRAHGADAAAAGLQFPLAHPAVACVLTGARNAAEVRDNAKFISADLPAELWRDLRTNGLIRMDAPLPG